MKIRRAKPGFPRITSSFSISGPDFDPADCTLATGIEPSVAALKGQKRRPKSRFKLLTSVWEVSAIKEESGSIDDGMVEVLDYLWPKKESLKAYLRRSKWSARFSTSLTVFDKRPLYVLGPETLSRMSYFGVDYTLDIHDYS